MLKPKYSKLKEDLLSKFETGTYSIDDYLKILGIFYTNSFGFSSGIYLGKWTFTSLKKI